MENREINLWLLSALKEVVRCVRGGDETSGVSMDDALIDADLAIEEAAEASARYEPAESEVK